MKLRDMALRKCDHYGCGHFGASRGQRRHNGVDLACPSGAEVQSPITGVITKHGIVYSDDHFWTYVEVSADGYAFRLFYVKPTLPAGTRVSTDTVIGHSQSLKTRYPKITDHIHFEIMNSRGDYIDPTPTLAVMRS